MTIELRVLTGARAGHRARFEGDVVTIGRHPQNDLQLDAERDRDASSRHAELHVAADGTVTVTDLASTNGTYVNGVRTSSGPVRDGDVVRLGLEGAQVEVRISGGRRAEGGAGDSATTLVDPAPRTPTAERVAIAVRAETSKLRRWGLAAIGLLVAGVAGAYWIGARGSAAEVAEMRRMLAGYDSTTVLLQRQLQRAADTAALARLDRTNDSLRLAATQASGGSPEDRAAIRERVSQWRRGATAMAAVDLPTINDRNAPAVAYLVSELGGRAIAGTAFAVTAGGLMVTNRHLVQAPDGAQATRLAVKFRNRSEWLPARLVRVASGEDDDLALIQLEHGNPVPAVAGLSRNPAPLREGAPVLTIGYPLGRSTRMDGEDGEGFIARTSLYPGTVSKSLGTVLQIAAFAGHGSSGSPVFDADGLVAGVVWGGPRESGGQIVYAVPASRVSALIAGR